MLLQREGDFSKGRMRGSAHTNNRHKEEEENGLLCLCEVLGLLLLFGCSLHQTSTNTHTHYDQDVVGWRGARACKGGPV